MASELQRKILAISPSPLPSSGPNRGKMSRGSFFPDFKIKISHCGNFSNFQKPKIFRDTQMSEPDVFEGVDVQLYKVSHKKRINENRTQKNFSVHYQSRDQSTLNTEYCS